MSRALTSQCAAKARGVLRKMFDTREPVMRQTGLVKRNTHFVLMVHLDLSLYAWWPVHHWLWPDSGIELARHHARLFQRQLVSDNLLTAQYHSTVLPRLNNMGYIHIWTIALLNTPDKKGGGGGGSKVKSVQRFVGRQMVCGAIKWMNSHDYSFHGTFHTLQLKIITWILIHLR